MQECVHSCLPPAAGCQDKGQAHPRATSHMRPSCKSPEAEASLSKSSKKWELSVLTRTCWLGEMLPELVTVILGPQAQPNRNVTKSQWHSNSKCTPDWKVMLLVCTILSEHCDLWFPIPSRKLDRLVTPSTFWVLALRFPLKQ